MRKQLQEHRQDKNNVHAFSAKNKEYSEQIKKTSAQSDPGQQFSNSSSSPL